jgi:hypothetical protein
LPSIYHLGSNSFKQLIRIQIQKSGKVLLWNQVKSGMDACYSELILGSYCLNNILRVSVQGVKSFGVHFACLCLEFDFYEVEKKEKGNTFTFLIIFTVKNLQKLQNDLQSAGINVQ